MELKRIGGVWRRGAGKKKKELKNCQKKKYCYRFDENLDQTFCHES